jgi:hypothetical protein
VLSSIELVSHVSPQPLPSNSYTESDVASDVVQSVQDGVLYPVQLVHDVSYRLKEFAARILISYQFPSNHKFQCIPSAPDHSASN